MNFPDLGVIKGKVGLGYRCRYSEKGYGLGKEWYGWYAKGLERGNWIPEVAMGSVGKGLDLNKKWYGCGG